MQVEVVYAWTAGVDATRVQIGAGSTVRQAIAASGVLARHPEIDLQRHKCGVFGKPRALDAALREGDRVEIYRPLALDPKEARRRRAKTPRV